MAIQFSARTDIGLTRDQNEDNFLIDRKLQLFIVCDGMGGHNSGEVASATAVNVVREILVKNRQVLSNYERGDTGATERDVRDLLTEAVQTANARIHERGIASPAQRGMGTTLCLLLIIGSRGFYAHVGDSRLYRQRGKAIEQLTMDHSFYNEVMLNQPELASELLDDRFKNAITRALGPTASVEVDTEDFPLKPGDRFMLCSDGLHGYLDEDEGALDRLMAMGDLDRAAEAMIRYANDQGGKDNTTAVIVEVGDEVADKKEVPKVFTILRGFPLLRHLKDPELHRLIGICDERRFEPGEKLWSEGDETDGLYIVVEGQLVITRMNTLISRIGPGQYVGSITVMDGGRRSAAAFADRTGAVTALVLSREGFNEVLLNQQDLGIKLLWGIARSLAARLRNATSRVVSSAPASPEFLKGDVEFKGGLQPGWQPAPADLDGEERKKRKKKRKKTKKLGTAALPGLEADGEKKKKKKKKKKTKKVKTAEPPAGFVVPDDAKPSPPTVEEPDIEFPSPVKKAPKVAEPAFESPIAASASPSDEPAKEVAAFRAVAPTLPTIPATAPSTELAEDVAAHVVKPDPPAPTSDPAGLPDVPAPPPEPTPIPSPPPVDSTPALPDLPEPPDADEITMENPGGGDSEDPDAEEELFTINNIFGTSSAPSRGGRRRSGRRGLRTRRGSVKGKSD